MPTERGTERQGQPGGLTRREWIGGVGGVGLGIGLGAAAVGVGASGAAPVEGSAEARPGGGGKHGGEGRADGRLPVVYLPHGGGPWPWVKLPIGDEAELGELAAYLRSVPAVPKAPYHAVVVVSAHWEEPVPTVMSAARPPMLYDYYGFPPESYTIQWPAPGHPALAGRVRELLGAAGFSTGSDPARGFDHGTFVPLKLAFPNADVPIVQLSLKQGLDPAEHLRMGRALAPLRDEGVFLVGSGSSYHNLRAFHAGAAPVAEAFDRWLVETIALPEAERDARLTAWQSAPMARRAHPREEHLLPLMVIAGAAGSDRGTVGYSGTVNGLRMSAHHFG